MKKIILIFMLMIWLIPVNTQEPTNVSSRKRVVIKQDTTKLDSIFIQQQISMIAMDSSLLKIKRQNATLDSLSRAQ